MLGCEIPKKPVRPKDQWIIDICNVFNLGKKKKELFVRNSRIGWYVEFKYPFGLGWSCVYICEFTFCSFFFFFFSCVSESNAATVHALFMNSSHKGWLFNSEKCIRALFTDPQISLFNNFFIKNGFHGTIHTFKNYFATIFSVSVKISLIQSDSKYSQRIWYTRPLEIMFKKVDT